MGEMIYVPKAKTLYPNNTNSNKIKKISQTNQTPILKTIQQPT